MLVSIVQHDTGPVFPRPRALGMPQGVMKQNRAPGRRTDLQRSGEQFRPLQIVRIGRVLSLVAARDDAQIALPTACHVAEVIANFELKKGDRPAQPTESLVVTILMPADAAAEGTVL